MNLKASPGILIITSGFAICFLFYGLVGFLLVLVLARLFVEFENGQPIPAVFVSAYAGGAIAGLYSCRVLLRNHNERGSWTLCNHTLVRGKSSSIQINLKNVETLIIGLPVPNVEAYRQFYPRRRYFMTKMFERNHLRSNTLVLKLPNKQYFPLYIDPIIAGSNEINGTLLELLESKVDPRYIYSDKERQLLVPRSVNKLISL